MKSGCNVKKAGTFFLFMILVIVILPFLIVRGCGPGPEGGGGKETKDLKIRVYVHTQDKIVEMNMEEYIKGVVAAEMPAEFELEALKAQAVAARTYAYGRMKKIYGAKDDVHKGADICTDPGHCQAWISKEEAFKKWKVFSSLRYWNKISRAVSETRGMLLLYNSTVVNPVFHANSGGKTENAEDVWEGGPVPYLKSVISKGEEDSGDFERSTDIGIEDFQSKLKERYPQMKLTQKDIMKDIKILNLTEGGRVKTIKIGNTSIKGTDFRSLFSLRSANFTLEKGGEETIKITTKGNGHGVGMSQWGANHMAKNGAGYEEILKYYYTGVKLAALKDVN